MFVPEQGGLIHATAGIRAKIAQVQVTGWSTPFIPAAAPGNA
jgi:hypothetical protein